MSSSSDTMNFPDSPTYGSRRRPRHLQPVLPKGRAPKHIRKSFQLDPSTNLVNKFSNVYSSQVKTPKRLATPKKVGELPALKIKKAPSKKGKKLSPLKDSLFPNPLKDTPLSRYSKPFGNPLLS